MRPGTVRKLICWSLFDQPRNARGRPKTQELPMVLLAIQELAARAATHDRHLRHGAQLAVAKTTCSNLTDGARPAVKNRRQAVFENTLRGQTGWLRDD